MDEKFFIWNQAGLIPGPSENEEQYHERVKYCLNLDREITNKLPFRDEDKGSHEILDSSFALTNEIYDIAPNWIPIFFSDYQMVLWHGGCAWIFQVDEKTPTAAIMQLRKTFQKNTKYLGLYDRQELIAHELAHVGRMMFEEPIFEEYHAYRSSKSTFRRWFGPIVQSSKESLFFVIVLLFIFILDVSLIALDQHSLYHWALSLKGLPLLLISGAIGRLIWRHRQYDRCLKALKEIVSSKEKANAIIYRLTDQEIIKFSKMSRKHILEYIDHQKNESLRWKIIASAYFC
jgi:hypothetical protein